MLPRFGVAEEAARLHEVMSFALTVAVLAERFRQVAGRGSAPDWCPLTEDVPASAVLKEVAIPRWYGALLLGRLVGEAGLVWLRQEPVAMRELAACFGEGPSELRAAGCTTLPARRTSSCPTALPRSLRWRGWTRRP